MLRYTVQRLLLGGLPLLFLIATITFLLMRATPGGPWDGGRPLPAATIENLDRRAGLQAPLPAQYGRFLLGLIQGDLGASLTRPGQSVAGLVRARAGASALLAGLALAIAVPAGLALGAAAARRPGGRLDRLSLLLGVLGSAIPAFVLAIGAILLFSLWLDLLPPGGWGRPQHLILPTLVLAILPGAILTRLTRTVVADALSAGYVRTAAAKGLSPRLVLVRHVLPNVAPAPLMLLGVLVADLAAGAFLVEYVFGIPGLGRLFVDAVFQRDYGVIMGVALFFAALVIVTTLAADLLHAALDPRVRRRLTEPQPSSSRPSC
ncbi:MAG: oligopeptide transport system permease protein [Chloroflexi bacterium]|nr:MAG: oligopeptide transport system permease protein [Chloroflexota bacterium]